MRNDGTGFELSSQKVDATRWRFQAADNLDEWGVQGFETLMTATVEELGELSQAYLEYQAEGGDRDRIQDELDDVAALMHQFQHLINEDHI